MMNFEKKKQALLFIYHGRRTGGEGGAHGWMGGGTTLKTFVRENDSNLFIIATNHKRKKQLKET